MSPFEIFVRDFGDRNVSVQEYPKRRKDLTHISIIKQQEKKSNQILPALANQSPYNTTQIGWRDTDKSLDRKTRGIHYVKALLGCVDN